MTIEWGYAGHSLTEGDESGDRHVVAPFDGGVLVAVIDGLGHGPEAAVAAATAARTLETHRQEPPDALVHLCHADLARTRGAVMSLARFDGEPAALTWLGVGNVEALLIRAGSSQRSPRELLSLRGGVVGYQLPRLHSTTITVGPGDTLIMMTDGICGDFIAGLDLHDSPQMIAESILNRHAKKTDDALVLVVRYLGSQLRDIGRELLAVGELRELIPVCEEIDVAIVGKEVKRLALESGFSGASAEGITIAAAELARNIVQYAASGEILLGRVREDSTWGLFVVARDRGPGMSDVRLALQDGYSSGGGLGLGLSSARRLSDTFEIISSPGEGTVVILKKWAS